MGDTEGGESVMAKVNISIPDNLLSDIDELAAQVGTSRSGLVQEAASRYITQVQEEREREERRESIERSFKSARELSKHVTQFDSTAAIRADRDRDGRKAGE
jgi:metal-responsive CopG/Arc/MetJ family transcriptional regulator